MVWNTEAYREPCQTSIMELFFANRPAIDNWLGSKCASEIWTISRILWFLFSETNSIPHVLVNLIKTNTFFIKQHLTASETTCTKVCKYDWRVVYISRHQRIQTILVKNSPGTITSLTANCMKWFSKQTT